jgi:hypothetical protein
VRRILLGAALAMGLCALVLAMSAPDGARSQALSTVALAIDGEHAVVMERDAQQHDLALARLQAETALRLAEERTWRLGIVVAGVAFVAWCLVVAYVALRRPAPVVVVQRLPGRSWRLLDEADVVDTVDPAGSCTALEVRR